MRPGGFFTTEAHRGFQASDFHLRRTTEDIEIQALTSACAFARRSG